MSPVILEYGNCLPFISHNQRRCFTRLAELYVPMEYPAELYAFIRQSIAG